MEQLLELFDINSCDVLLDNGVLKYRFNIKKPKNEERFLETIGKLWKIDRWQPYLISTPLMLLEALNIGTSQIDPFLIKPEFLSKIQELLKDATEENFNEIMEQVLAEIEKNILDNALLKREPLIAVFQEEMKLRSKHGGEFFRTCFEGNLKNEDAYQELITRIALDVTQSPTFAMLLPTPELQKKFDLQWFIALYRSNNEGFGRVSIARLVDQALLRAHREINPESVDEVEKPYSPLKDRVDTEIVHYALLGNYRKEVGRRKVVIFSTELLESWRLRLSRYLALINYLNDSLGSTVGRVEMTPGYIFHVSNDGSIAKDYIDVKKEFLS